MDYSTQLRIRRETGFDSVVGEPFQVSRSTRTRNSYAYIPKSMWFSQI